MARVIIAARLSRTVTGQSGIETQDQAARQWAEDHGHTVVATVVDRGVSGKTDPFKRPGLGAWLTDPEKLSIFDGVVAYDVDRLSRSYRDTPALRAWAEDNAKTLDIVSDNLHWPDPDSGMIWAVKAELAEAEWTKMRDRTRRSQGHLREKGALTGKAAFGYAISGERGAKRLVVVEHEADALRQAVSDYLAGASLRELCQKLEADGVVSRGGAKWQPKTLSQIFRNRILIGQRTSRGGKTVVLKVPPILDRETWDKLQAELDRKAHRQGIAPGSTAMLTSVLHCGACDGPMYRYASTNTRRNGSKTTTFYYRCHGTARSASACKNYISLAELHDWLDGMFSESQLYGQQPAVRLEFVPGSGHAEELADVEAELRALDFDSADFTQRQAALLAERSRLKSLPNEPGTMKEIPLGCTVGQAWAKLSEPGKRKYMMEHGLTVSAKRGEYVLLGSERSIIGEMANM